MLGSFCVDPLHRSRNLLLIQLLTFVRRLSQRWTRDWVVLWLCVTSFGWWCILITWTFVSFSASYISGCLLNPTNLFCILNTNRILTFILSARVVLFYFPGARIYLYCIALAKITKPKISCLHMYRHMSKSLTRV